MIQKVIMLAASALTLAGCGGGSDACSGFAITGTSTQSSFTVPELMAHASAMGMTQAEAETLIYLEGISPNTRLAPGETLCIDGRPDR
jgi:hypothetical protein